MAPNYECPACGVVYEKADMTAVKHAEQRLKSAAEHERFSIKIGVVMVVAAAALFVLNYFKVLTSVFAAYLAAFLFIIGLMLIGFDVKMGRGTFGGDSGDGGSDGGGDGGGP